MEGVDINKVEISKELSIEALNSLCGVSTESCTEEERKLIIEIGAQLFDVKDKCGSLLKMIKK